MGGEMNMACITCHFPSAGSGDGLRLSRGVGAHGTGSMQAMSSTPGALAPRNAPPIWNSGLFKMQFWDGRISQVDPNDPSKGVLTPDGLHTDVISSNAAQAMFPETSAGEMRGAAFPGQDTFGVRESLAARIRAIPAYVTLFTKAYGDGAVTPGRVGTAIGAYEDHLLVVDTPWFAYVRSVVASNGVSGIDRRAIDDASKRGALLFYGKAVCSACHAGDMGDDGGFHNVGVPQFGPGKGDGLVVNGGSDDFGRERVTRSSADRYKFRTPTMVNVGLHGPYGHDGAYKGLRDFVAHYNNVGSALATYNNDNGTLEPELQATLRDVAPIAATLDPLVSGGLGLSSSEIDDLTAFLQAQTDPSASTKFTAEIPSNVPSGLPVDPAF
jgi:cytochrome c peroxidase